MRTLYRLRGPEIVGRGLHAWRGDGLGQGLWQVLEYDPARKAWKRDFRAAH